MKNPKIIALILLSLVMAGGIFLQHSTNRSLQLELNTLQDRNAALQAEVELSQLIADDLRAELMAFRGQPAETSTARINTNENTDDNATILSDLSGVDRYLLELQRSTAFGATHIERQAEYIVRLTYTDFIHNHFRTDADQRLALRELLQNLEAERIKELAEFQFGQNRNIDPNSLNRATYDEKMDNTLATILSPAEVDAFRDYRANRLPLVVRRNVSNRIDGGTRNLSTDNRKLLADALTEIQLIELADLDFEESLSRQAQLMEELQQRVELMESGQAAIAGRFLELYNRSATQLLQSLLIDNR